MASSWDRSKTDRWEKGFAALSKFRAREGHCHPSRYHMDGNFKLGPWVTTQRYNKDNLSAERKRRLNAIGFVWKWRDYLWDRGFTALSKFKQREGTVTYRPSTVREITNLDIGFPRNAELRKKCQPSERRG